MKINYTLSTLLCSAILFAGCGSDIEEVNVNHNVDIPTPELNAFAPNNNAGPLIGNAAEKVNDLLKTAIQSSCTIHWKRSSFLLTPKR